MRQAFCSFIDAHNSLNSFLFIVQRLASKFANSLAEGWFCKIMMASIVGYLYGRIQSFKFYATMRSAHNKKRENKHYKLKFIVVLFQLD